MSKDKWEFTGGCTLNEKDYFTRGTIHNNKLTQIEAGRRCFKSAFLIQSILSNCQSFILKSFTEARCELLLQLAGTYSVPSVEPGSADFKSSAGASWLLSKCYASTNSSWSALSVGSDLSPTVGARGGLAAFRQRQPNKVQPLTFLLPSSASLGPTQLRPLTSYTNAQRGLLPSRHLKMKSLNQVFILFYSAFMKLLFSSDCSSFIALLLLKVLIIC